MIEIPAGEVQHPGRAIPARLYGGMVVDQDARGRVRAAIDRAASRKRAVVVMVLFVVKLVVPAPIEIRPFVRLNVLSVWVAVPTLM